MKKLILILLVILLPKVGLSQDREMGECLYSQEAFQLMLEHLQGEYSDAKYTNDRKSLIIFLEKGTVKVSYSGCEHYSTEINYIFTHNNISSTEEAFVKVIELLQLFGQDRVNLKVLERLLNQEKYIEFSPGMFNISYKEMDEFVVVISKIANQSSVNINFYN